MNKGKSDSDAKEGIKPAPERTSADTNNTAKMLQRKSGPHKARMAKMLQN